MQPYPTVSEFRKDNLEVLSGQFLHVLALCPRAGLVDLGRVKLDRVVLDGAKVKANASKHREMS